MEKTEIKSDLLKEHWENASEIYYFLEKELKDLDYEEDYEKLDEIIFEAWEKFYSDFVLNPIKEDVLKMFHHAQTSDFESKSSMEGETKIYSVYYYLAQYFSIGIATYDQSEDFPSFEFNDLNMTLYYIFEEIVEELNLEGFTEEDLFEEKCDYYDLEVELLSEFLSECWNEVKTQTKQNVKAFLSEATGCGGEYSLDENREIKEN
ncbi:hypothetical protein [Aureivirga sp. CE67]|uniref:hypothetical protein n=1 Tax=Aureivirga sp. CE67 TaxID=1788983 RepID=UPI0018CBE7B3|nr:hypothetical protein [Aureivirga sp. CE67]